MTEIQQIILSISHALALSRLAPFNKTKDSQLIGNFLPDSHNPKPLDFSVNMFPGVKQKEYSKEIYYAVLHASNIHEKDLQEAFRNVVLEGASHYFYPHCERIDYELIRIELTFILTSRHEWKANEFNVDEFEKHLCHIKPEKTHARKISVLKQLTKRTNNTDLRENPPPVGVKPSVLVQGRHKLPPLAAINSNIQRKVYGIAVGARLFQCNQKEKPPSLPTDRSVLKTFRL